MLDDRQRLSAAHRIDAIRRATTNLDVVWLCDLALKLLPLTKPPVTVNTPPRVTTTPPAQTPPPKIVTVHPPKKARGRPPTGKATPAAERSRKYRARRKAAEAADQKLGHLAELPKPGG